MDNNEDELMAGADSEERDHNLGYEEEMEGEDGGAEMDAEAIDPIIDADSFVSPTKQSDPSAKKKTVKKPLTAFILYMGDMREKLMKENPGLKFGEIGKMVGEMYKGLSAEERDHYSNLAKQDKERYIREYEEFKAHSALHPEEYAVPVAKISDTTLTIPVVRIPFNTYMPNFEDLSHISLSPLTLGPREAHLEAGSGGEGCVEGGVSCDNQGYRAIHCIPGRAQPQPAQQAQGEIYP